MTERKDMPGDIGSMLELEWRALLDAMAPPRESPLDLPPDRRIAVSRAALFAQLEVGTVYMNQCDTLDPALPWTGIKDSGKGSSLSSLGFLHLTRPKGYNFKL